MEWRIQDQDGVRHIRNRALYVPTAGVRLFSPQSYFKENNGGSLLCQPDGLLLTLHGGCTLSFSMAIAVESTIHGHDKYVRANESTRQRGQPSDV
jgi:hypothetical protein